MIGLTILRSSVDQIEMIRDAPGDMPVDEYEAIVQLRKSLTAVEMMILVVGVYADNLRAA